MTLLGGFGWGQNNNVESTPGGKKTHLGRGIFQVVEGSQGWLHLSTGRADRWRNWGIVTLVVQVVAVVGGLPFGATGVAVVVVMTSLLIAVPWIVMRRWSAIFFKMYCPEQLAHPRY